jgi:anthraniloyl-CoA monooxygenase
MNILCVGGGPAGLYLAILMKKRDLSHRIVIYERNPRGVVQGWGVTLADDVLEQLRQNDPESLSELLAKSFAWSGYFVNVRGEEASSRERGTAIGRQELLDLLAHRAASLGVEIHYGREITNDHALKEFDVIILSDGVNSRLRQTHAQEFRTTRRLGANKMLWLGTTKLFKSFMINVASTPAGWIWFYAYAFDQQTSTFIVECSNHTWQALRFHELSREQSIAQIEQIFHQHLAGHRLLTRQSERDGLSWLNFKTIRNENWHAGKLVLIGDAAHSMHFSIGSGTRLALLDAISLSRHLSEQKDISAALLAYQHERQPEAHSLQQEANRSALWYETIPRFAPLDASMFLSLMHARRSIWIHRLPPRLYYALLTLKQSHPLQLLSGEARLERVGGRPIGAGR